MIGWANGNVFKQTYVAQKQEKSIPNKTGIYNLKFLDGFIPYKYNSKANKNKKGNQPLARNFDTPYLSSQAIYAKPRTQMSRGVPNRSLKKITNGTVEIDLSDSFVLDRSSRESVNTDRSETNSFF